jgi:hypothetical protein
VAQVLVFHLEVTGSIPAASMFFRDLSRFLEGFEGGWLLPKPENTEKPLVRTSPEVYQNVIGQARTFERASLATELATEYLTRA